MAIKQMELAFQFTRFSEGNVKRLMRWGSLLRERGELKYVSTKSPDVEVGYEYRHSNLEFYVFLQGKCVGNVTFDYQDTPKELRRLFKGKKVATPHVGFLPSMRGLGYPSMIYGLALKHGTVLASDHHTQSAAGLWEAVARKYNAKIAYTSEVNGWKLSETSVDEDDWKVMYL